jgi:hypothetical protein
MLLVEIALGLKIFRYSLIGLFVLLLIITLFSKKISSTEKKGFWLDMLLMPLGTLYELYVWFFRSKKSK